MQVDIRLAEDLKRRRQQKRSRSFGYTKPLLCGKGQTAKAGQLLIPVSLDAIRQSLASGLVSVSVL